MKVKHNITKIYLYHFFRSFIWAYVIERLFWASRGMTITTTVYTEFLYAFLIIGLEIPSGLFADRFSRRSVVLVGSAFNVLCYCVLFAAYGPLMFSLSIALSAVNGALTSGSINALAYDSLVEINKVSYFERYLSRVSIIKYTSGFAAALLGAYFATHMGLLFNYQVSFISVILSLVISMTLVEPQRQRGKSEEEVHVTHTLKSLSKLTLITLKSNVFLRRMMLMAGAICGTIVYVEEFWQNYFLEVKLSPSYFGIISALMSLSVIVASHYSPKIIEKCKQYKNSGLKKYSALLLLMTALFMGIGLSKHLFALIFMCLATGLSAINSNMILADIHHKVSSENRATMESVFSVIERTFVILAGLLFGFVSDRFSVFSGFVAVSVFLLVVFLLAHVIGGKRSAVSVIVEE